MAKFPLSEMALNMFCPGNVLMTDDAGLPSVMVYIPKFKLSDVLTGGDDSIHPAFIVNGVEIPGFYYSKYQNVVYNGKAYSLPAEDPSVSVNFYTALEYCEGKGYGWHLSTAVEWAAVALWCKKNGFLPYGNNSYGKDSRESEYLAVPTYKDANSGQTLRVATGTGPKSWSHDGTTSGIWDMNGNIWEWQGGIRLVWGELQILANNDAADSDNPQNKTSTRWKAISASDGSLVEPESYTTDTAVKDSGNTVKLDYVDSAWIYSTGITSSEDKNRSTNFGDVTCTASISTAAKVLLRALALLPDEGEDAAAYEGDRVHWNNGLPECGVFRGGDWGSAIQAGMFFSYGSFPRSILYHYIGFRAAFAQF